MSEGGTAGEKQAAFDEGLDAVKSNRVTSLEEYFELGYKIKDPQVVDLLMPKLREELISMSPVQKQTDAGERTRIRAILVIGDENGHVGFGIGKAAQVSEAIGKASRKAKLNSIAVRRGCGSWECKCGQQHSVPFKISSKAGSVRVDLIPAPKGLGLVASEATKIVLKLAGIRDVWSRTSGSTATPVSTVMATFDALRKTYMTTTQSDWGA
jgi:small subunit ribosomal protein S5